MFAVATHYENSSPGLHMTRFGELAWESFFEAVADDRMASVVYYDGQNGVTRRVEFEDGIFKFKCY